MHDFALQERQVLGELAAWIADRRDAPVLIPPGSAGALPAVGRSGIGIRATWALLRDVLLPSSFPADHPRYLAFVGGSPTPAAVIADAALSAAAVYGGSELEAGDVVVAERMAVRWLCDVIGYPEDAHGVFVSGGSLANLSALVAARHDRVGSGGGLPDVIVISAAAHSSIRSAAAIMGCRVVSAGSPDHPTGAADLATVLDSLDPRDVVAVVANAGATNTGAIDDLAGIAATCEARGIWMHVDAAYGGAALLSPTRRPQFDGIQRADSVTIDPHKWLFTPFDCAAVLYLDPAVARSAHRQRAAYLDAVDNDDDNPADYAAHLTRRARGIPVWASLVANGTDAYVDAVETCLAVAGYAAKQVEAAPHLELVTEPRLSVVLFRRIGWDAARYAAWSAGLRSRRTALVTPTTYAGKPALRLCFVNPLTSTDDVDFILNTLEPDTSPALEDVPDTDHRATGDSRSW
ncbi:pyridoxal phosphate-dependent decarboxylase family protein [Aeromicrobium wangtongii]|uniref:Aminotransferase class V-fold PLP-dependent enzyme n=1 Tax=Aeromicrobium wangtongii TaxID=2969247 RepID=A0ABY5MB24_9ACTN|nr:aminotransferase class V-fold PLP-dependent enzyme [Aeromicrobium wangtongii]MCD9196807.1 aminotransferase class V-fold PLP-dependent enzyme [Aeromicrobium wangtongii]UUP14316.1 aminotransferase class V-fold PLP-dependent enzyme [Aeromicrobium wangtongii]